MKKIAALFRTLDANPDRLVVQACLGCLMLLPLVLLQS